MRKRQAAPELARDVDLVIKIKRFAEPGVAECEEPCECSPTDLKWFDKVDKTYSIIDIYGFVGSGSFLLTTNIEFHAKVLGVLCDQPVEWSIGYSNQFIEQYSPRIEIVDHVLFVGPKQDELVLSNTAIIYPGIITFTATVCNMTLGPISLNILLESEPYLS